MYNRFGNIFMFYRIIDANLNRTQEALRCIEEYARFILNNEEFSTKLKNLRHKITLFFEKDYINLINSRDTKGDIGTTIKNITKENFNSNVLRANFKRLEQALRVLNEYGNLGDSFRYEIYELEKEIMLEINKKTNIKRALLNDRKLYLITNSDNFSSQDEFIDKVALALKSGVKLIQYREKTLPAKTLIETGKKLRQLCSIYNALFIVNDRLDIAKILDADGVHLGQDDIDIKYAKEYLGEDKIIGISTHKPDDAVKAFNDGADYIGVGPVFKTPTKPNTTPVGLEYVKWVKDNLDIPFYAIGSIDLDNVQKVIEAGAKNVAVIRAIMNSDDVNETVKKFNEILN